jgi:hypothetical protein
MKEQSIRLTYESDYLTVWEWEENGRRYRKYERRVRGGKGGLFPVLEVIQVRSEDGWKTLERRSLR